MHLNNSFLNSFLKCLRKKLHLGRIIYYPLGNTFRKYLLLGHISNRNNQKFMNLRKI
jgi:hypothetical protein